MTQWQRSHDFGISIFEALLHLLIELFLNVENEDANISEEQVMNSIDLLLKENVVRFCKERPNSLKMMSELLSTLSEDVMMTQR